MLSVTRATELQTMLLLSSEGHYALSSHKIWWVQNLVDSLSQHFQEAVPQERHEQLNTFVVYNQRSRVTSSAKRKRQPGSLKIHQTPDGSFLDLMRNGRDVLLRCCFDVPQVLSFPETLCMLLCIQVLLVPVLPAKACGGHVQFQLLY